jgi:hypothetical protein
MVYCMRCPVKWPGIAGYAGQEQRVSTVRDNSRSVGAEGNVVYCMRCPVKRPGIAGYASRNNGCLLDATTHAPVGAEGNGLLYAMSG